MKIFYFFIITISVSGCNPFGDFKPNSADIMRKNWAKNPQKDTPDPLYCYHTLADSVCYTEPLEGNENRLTGSFAHQSPVVPDDVTWLEDLQASLKRESA
jgi:hypothetical protein